MNKRQRERKRIERLVAIGVTLLMGLMAVLCVGAVGGLIYLWRLFF